MIINQDRAHYLALAVNPSKFAEVAFEFKPDEYQDGVLKRPDAEQLIVWSRQFGKSATVATLCLHTAVFNPDSVVLVAAQRKEVAQEMIRKARKGTRMLCGGFFPTVKKDNAGSLELSNGSRIMAVSGSESGPRGYTVNLVVIDEASRVPEEYYEAVTPTQSTVNRPKFIAMTTPYGRRGWFWDLWTKNTGCFKQVLTYHDCPRISADFIAKEKARLPDYIFRQEYLCEFIDPKSAVFDYEDFMACINDNIETIGLKF